MQRRMARLIAVGVTGLAVATGLVAIAQGAMATTNPKLLPGPQRWIPGAGEYTFRPGTRLVVFNERLMRTARVFAADLTALTGVSVEWTIGGEVHSGDIALRIGPANGGAEGYRLTVGPTLVVQGQSDAGVFYGTRSILQLLRQTWNVSGGIFDDWPAYPERGLLLDVGRKYFSPSFLRERIRELAYLKLNYLHLHLSENLGFRLESESHPEITSAVHYTKQEIRELIDYAAGYHVQIVPEIDFPGHMEAILASHPDLRLVSRTGVVNPGFIDLSKPESYALMRDLITEYLPLFPSGYWHIGGDEYVTDYADYPQLGGKDAYHRFINWANDLVRAAGKTTRMWNDGLKPGGATISISPDIVVEHWSAGGLTPWVGPALSPRQLIAAGHRVVNAAFTPTYFTNGGPAAPFNVAPALMYDTWNPNVFVDATTLTVAERTRNLGSRVHVWCDNPNARTEAEIATAIDPRLRVMAQHTWGSPKPAPLYLMFQPLINAVGEAPA
jgi:hexosaminidase